MDPEWLAKQFDAQRTRLHAVAYRMLGSLSDAEDAVQGTWLRLSRSDSATIDNLAGWLTTAVARECLDMLRSRRTRREESLDVHVPDPVVRHPDQTDPEHEALVADSVGLALLVVLETLNPAERVAFVLHDVFAVPYDEIAPIVSRSPTAARKLASRARRRVQNTAPTSDGDLADRHEVVDAFLKAARHGDLEALVAVLEPTVVVRADTGTRTEPSGIELRGADTVARQAITFAASLGEYARPAIVNGEAGVVAIANGQALSVMGFTIRQGMIIEINILTDPDRLRRLSLPALDDTQQG